ncbi:MAG: biotin--[acetyl-CoA-carboxylase] ligase [Spirochaetaceae bacterium]|nr:biotin--[acetyl-CoA-carboxylase] ligase [Spirochaetaceae bacterium]
MPSPKATILERLRASPEPVSGESLAEELGVSRVAVWKQLEALREAGYALEADRSGYRLAAEKDFLYPWEFAGREDRIVRYERTDSTMDRALELALADPGRPAVVVAEAQSAGRGRRGRRWNSPRGGLFATLVVPPELRPWRAERLTMAGAVALCESLRALTGEPFSLAWPNDLFLGGRKAAGLLIEYLVEGDEERLSLLGLGVNVANRAPGEGAFSLAELAAPRPTRRDILSAFLDRFEAIGLEWEGLPAAWNSLSSQAGNPVLSRDDDRRLGRALAVDAEGRLLVGLEGGGEAAFRPGEAKLATKELLA